MAWQVAVNIAVGVPVCGVPVEIERVQAPPQLKANVPGASDKELTFRTRCAAGLLNWLVLAPVAAELRNKSEKQIERRLVPVLAGACRGTSIG
jgi:hypothetical protein